MIASKYTRLATLISNVEPCAAIFSNAFYFILNLLLPSIFISAKVMENI